MICQQCGSKKDVIDFYLNEKEVILCVDCRYELALRAKRNAKLKKSPHSSTTM